MNIQITNVQKMYSKKKLLIGDAVRGFRGWIGNPLNFIKKYRKISMKEEIKKEDIKEINTVKLYIYILYICLIFVFNHIYSD